MIDFYEGWPNNGQYVNLLNKSKKYLINYLNNNSNIAKKSSIIVDFDDTLVYTNPGGKSNAKFINVDKQTLFIFPEILQISSVVKYAKKLGFKIIILTARPQSSFLSTKFNLELYGIPYDYIYMNSHNKHISFKKDIRKILMKRYNIILSIGDQVYDVNGPTGMLGFKLPSLDSKKLLLFK